jgi:small subunit ribosomal protein S20
MANTRSAAKQARQSLRHRLHNRTIKTHLHTLERKYHGLAQAGQTDEATKVLSDVFAALDRAAKSNVIHRNAAARKKSRLAARLKAKAA